MGSRQRRRRSRPTPRPVLRKNPGMRGRIREGVISLLPVLAIFLGTRVALAEAYRIPSGSMEPTLQVGDWLFVNKLKFGAHIPFTHRALPGYATSYDPNQGIDFIRAITAIRWRRFGTWIG